jgi:hypothetical protein
LLGKRERAIRRWEGRRIANSSAKYGREVQTILGAEISTTNFEQILELEEREESKRRIGFLLETPCESERGVGCVTGEEVVGDGEGAFAKGSS